MPRPKEFDPDKALEKAMQVFWRKGYEATSVQDLVDQMGINRFSLYATFGDKHRLFLSALNRYQQKLVSENLRALEHSQEGLQAIRRFFQASVEWALAQKSCQGCLMTNSTVELAAHDKDAAAIVRASLKRIEEAFYKALLRAREKGEIGESQNLRDYARFLTNNAQGLGVLTKVRPDRRVLEGIIRIIFAGLKKI